MYRDKRTDSANNNTSMLHHSAIAHRVITLHNTAQHNFITSVNVNFI